MFTYVAYFDRKVGIYMATKLFPFAFRKELYAILAGRKGFSGPARAIAYGPHTGIFSIVSYVGLYGSYDKNLYVLHERKMLLHACENPFII